MDNMMNIIEDLLRTLKSINDQSSERIKQIQDFFPYNSTDSSGATLLHHLVRRNSESLVKFLLDGGCDPNIEDSEGLTPLMISVQNDNERVTEMLFRAGANILEANKNNQSALHFLATHHTMKDRIIELFFQELRKKYSTSEEIAEKLMDVNCPIYNVILLKDPTITEQMLKKNFPVDLANPTVQTTAMHKAASCSDLENVELLLNYGAEVNALNENSESPLYYLNQIKQEDTCKKLKILKILLNQGASTTSCISEDFFHSYCILAKGDREAVRVLLDFGLDFNAKDSNSQKNILHYFSKNINPGVAEECKPYIINFNVDGVYNHALSALFIATIYGNVDMVKLLLEQGAQADLEYNTLDRNPLNIAFSGITEPATEHQYNQCGEILLQYNADPQVKRNVDGEVVIIFDTASSTGKYERFKSVVCHIALLEKLGTTITELTMAKINSRELLQKYFKECREILTIEISERIVLVDLLRSHKKKMARYLNNENIARKLQDETYFSYVLEHFSYYRNVLHKRYLEGKNYMILKNDASHVICKIVQNRIGHSHLIVDSIVDYLDDESLRKLSLI